MSGFCLARGASKLLVREKAFALMLEFFRCLAHEVPVGQATIRLSLALAFRLFAHFARLA